MQINVRRASPSDVGWLIEELKSFSVFFGTKLPIFGNERDSREILLGLIGNHYFMIAENTESVPVGFIAGLLNPHMLNPGLIVLAELFWWVKPEFRGSRAGAVLLNEFITYGEEHADWITFVLEKNSPVKEGVLLNRGFHLQERSYLKEAI